MIDTLRAARRLLSPPPAVRVERAVAVVRASTGEHLFTVGGVYDPSTRGIVASARAPLRMELKETQVAPGLGFAAVLDQRLREVDAPGLIAGPALEVEIARRGLRDGVERPIVITLFASRGKGKTHLALAAQLWTCAAIPGAVTWIVPPASTRLDEMRMIFDAIAPPRWCEWKERAAAWHMANGSRIRVISGDDSDSVRQGGFELALQNEAQAQTWDVYTTLVAGVRNVKQRPHGLLMLGGNYALKARGDYTNDIIDGIANGSIPGWHFDMDAVSGAGTGPVPARLEQRIDAAIRAVSPAAADADARGVRRRLGELAFPAFRPWPVDRVQTVATSRGRIEGRGHVGRPPEVCRDVTIEVLRQREGVRSHARVVLTADFQQAPGCVAAEGRVFRRPSDGRNLYAIVRYFAPDGGTETALGEQLVAYYGARGIAPRDIWIIGDSSGATQDGAHTPGAFENGRTSFDVLRGFGFTVTPLVYAVGKTAKTEAGKNPDVDDSVRQVIDVMEDERLLVDPDLTRVIEALRRAKLKRRPSGAVYMDPSGGHSHPGDVVRYFVHAFEPAPGAEMVRDTGMVARVLATKGVFER